MIPLVLKQGQTPNTQQSKLIPKFLQDPGRDGRTGGAFMTPHPMPGPGCGLESPQGPGWDFSWIQHPAQRWADSKAHPDFPHHTQGQFLLSQVAPGCWSSPWDGKSTPLPGMTPKLLFPWNIPHLTAITPRFRPFSTASPPREALGMTEVVPSQPWRIPGFGNPSATEPLPGFVPLLLGLIFLSSRALFFSKLQKGGKKKEKEKSGKELLPVICLAGYKSRNKRGRGRGKFSFVSGMSHFNLKPNSTCVCCFINSSWEKALEL